MEIFLPDQFKSSFFPERVNEGETWNQMKVRSWIGFQENSWECWVVFIHNENKRNVFLMALYEADAHTEMKCLKPECQAPSRRACWQLKGA